MLGIAEGGGWPNLENERRKVGCGRGRTDARCGGTAGTASSRFKVSREKNEVSLPGRDGSRNRGGNEEKVGGLSS